MITPAIHAERSQPDPRSIVAQTGIWEAWCAEEEPILATVDTGGAAIFVGQRPAVPQVKARQDRLGIGAADQRQFDTAD